ncbi:MAG: 3-deoxy-D-manno-octulosonic acid kinase [Planctomycetes bacterium]|nr:3-deoxy-D-manno-octulosonic acid kinase [Planctomycetota bacterium]
MGPTAAELPRGFVRRSSGGADMVLREDVADALAASLADPASARLRAVREFRGRGRPFSVEVPGAGRVFVRPYLHGGVLGRVTGARHVGDGRFLGELRAHVDAEAAGVPVCRALGVVSRRADALFRAGWLLLEEVPGARDVEQALAEGLAPAARRAILAASGRSIRALHDAGFDHPDLHLKNLLADGAAVRVLDLDRVKRARPLPRERRLAGLFRFDRYAAKVAAAGHPVTRADRMRVLRAYAGADWPSRDDLRALASRLAAHIARHDAVRPVRGAAL